MKRVIQRLILDPLALKIVTGEIQEGDRVTLDLEKGKLIFKNLKRLVKTKKKALVR